MKINTITKRYKKKQNQKKSENGEKRKKNYSKNKVEKNI